MENENETQPEIVLDLQNAVNAAKVIEYSITKGLPGNVDTIKRVLMAYDSLMIQLKPYIDREQEASNEATEQQA